MTGIAGRRPIAVGITTLDAELAPELAALRLSEADVARAGAYRGAADRERFLRGRWLLRTMAAEATGILTEQIELEATDLGRPVLLGAASGTFVSLAHSGSFVIAAVADIAVGIDVEELPARALHPGMEARICSPTELGRLSRLADQARQAAFMAIWARKEAYGKALGVGLDFPFRSVTVGPAGNRVQGIADRFWVSDLDVAPGYAAAIVSEGRGRQLDVRRYPKP
jgi:4'-phosphopantetheinyl transferase